MRTFTWEQVREIRAGDKARDDVERYDLIVADILNWHNEECAGWVNPLHCEKCATVDAVIETLASRLLPPGECDCGDYGTEPDGREIRDRSHLTVTDCCEVYRFLCETGTVLDGAGDPDVTACRAGMGCDQ